MDTVRVNICYRPLRICWAIRAGDIKAFRKAVRLSHTMWGGHFNPIVVVDRLEEAKSLVEVFRADMVMAIGDSDEVREFPKRFSHLMNPFFHDDIFIGRKDDDARTQVLDIHNALVHLHDTAEWKVIKKQGVRLYTWAPDDPLSDTFLIQYGAYPDVEEIHIDYSNLVKQAAEATEHSIEADIPIPSNILEHPSVTYLSRHGLRRHYSVRSSWDYPGFYIGDSKNVDDLVCYWNLQASDITVLFVDRNHIERYSQIIPTWKKLVSEMLAYRRLESSRHTAIWTREESPGGQSDDCIVEVRRIFGDDHFSICGISPFSWNGLNIRPPMMHFREVATLGVISTDKGKPKLSFGLTDKPFCSDTWFHTQHLVASLSFIGGLYEDENYTLDVPYIPELNEFYARTMHFEYDKLRAEPERIGLVIDAADADAFIYAVPVAKLFEWVFDLVGFSVRPSSSGLITRQLISQLGGLRGAVVFKIPGVRRLLKTHGPTAPFTKRAALQLIASKDPDNPDAKFSDYEDLYIEPRPLGTKLQPDAVFAYLVDKGLFRIGAELTCPHCKMANWTALDALKQRVNCEMCGHDFDATRQLVDGEWHYRRSGVLGAEKNAQGAVPVVLTLQQLSTNLGGALRNYMYSPSLDLIPKNNTNLPKCEVDFVWLITQRSPDKTIVILGECKDRGHKNEKGGDGGTINAKDIENLRRVADAFPSDRFEIFVLLAKLCPFTAQEIESAKTLNDKYRYRAILLTARELEPYHIYDRMRGEHEIRRYAGSAEGLALTTTDLYFKEPQN